MYIHMYIFYILIFLNSLTVSGIGRVLPFYSKCSRVIPEIKRAADNLISKEIKYILIS